MSSVPKSVKGTFDVLPFSHTSVGNAIPASSTWADVEETIRNVFARFSMGEIRTPILEPTDLIARGVGEATDIVTKEMFAFSREGTDYVLRPEMTAPVMRAFLENNLAQRGGGVQRLFYIGPCFRAERPQKGRYRQFHQFGCEIIGSESPFADAEAIISMMSIYAELGIVDTTLRINSLGDAGTRPRYTHALLEYFAPLKNQLSETSRRRMQENPLRLLDTKNEEERELLSGAPIIVDFLDKESRDHFENVKSLLSDSGIAFDVDPFLVRGLDYYSRTAFELESPALGAQSALAGGGRYDLLAKDIGHKKEVPAVGFAAGMERLFLAMNHDPDNQIVPDVFLVCLGEEARRWGFGTASELRKRGIRTEFDISGRSLKAQMREADRSGAKAVLIVGEDEMSSGTAVFKDMLDGTQLSYSIESVVSEVMNRLDDVS